MRRRRPAPGSVVVEQGEHPGGVRSQGLSALCESLEERGGGGDDGAQPVAGGVDVGLAVAASRPSRWAGCSTVSPVL